MKRALILAAIIFAAAGSAFAQNYMVVNTEKIFKSMPSYTSAVAQLDTLAQRCQADIDDAFDQLEQTYNDYQAQKASLSASQRQAREKAILDREAEINRYQENVFGQKGTLVTRRVELLKPIQDKVFEVIEKYAREHGYQIVLDTASNPSIIYSSPEADKTEAITELVKAIK